jgi:hypothetical protein
MKIRLLFFAAFLVLASCSEDDSNTPIPENPIVKNLDKMTGTFYFEGGVQRNHIIEFENNKRVSYHIYNMEDELVVYTLYTYSSEGLLLTEEYFNGNNELQSRVSYDYDSEGKIIKRTRARGNEEPETKDFIYNSDNTISCIAFISGSTPETSTLKYYLNDMGIIYKMFASFDNSFEEIIFNGGLATSLSRYNSVFSGPSTLTYTYDMQTPVKGEFINMFKNQYGHINNAILCVGLNGPFFTNHYILEEGNAKYEYAFDNDGFPIREKIYLDLVLRADFQILYE